LRLFTLPPFPPRPRFNVPRFRRRIALSTRLPAALPYFRRDLWWLLDFFFRPPDDFFLAAMIAPML
jgi:hypothetical protein